MIFFSLLRKLWVKISALNFFLNIVTFSSHDI